MPNKWNLTWQDVFNSDWKPWWGHIEKILPVVHDSGYHYFTWAGRVHKLLEVRGNGKNRVYDTEDMGIPVEDLV